jgi:AraC-like DNA-binding protein
MWASPGRYLHKLFEDEEMTYSRFVLNRRLSLAYRKLRHPRFATRTISSIANDTGFGDLSYFNRTFRRRYDITPSDARRGKTPARSSAHLAPGGRFAFMTWQRLATASARSSTWTKFRLTGRPAHRAAGGWSRWRRRCRPDTKFRTWKSAYALAPYLAGQDAAER